MRKSWRACRVLVLAVVAVTMALGLTATVSVAGRPGAASAAPAGTPGYWLVGSDGSVYNLNTANYGTLRGVHLAQPVVGGAPTSDGRGYWMVASDGGIFTFGDAAFAGSTGNVRLAKPIVGMAADPETGGYWMVAADGGVFSFNAPFYGSTGNVRLQQPIVGMAVTPDGGGYWLVASDGGVFTFGDAGFYGSTGNVHLAKPIVGMAPTPSGHGYWLVASDGGVFTFGDAGFYGSTGAVHLQAPVKSMQATADGQGYWLSATDGGIFTFGDAPFLGSAAGTAKSPVVAMLSVAAGYPFPPGSTGYDVSNFQCNETLPPARAFAIVQVAGSINGTQNPCYTQEIGWAGADASSYIFMDGLPSPAPAESLQGPAGTCSGSATCEGYNFGWYWARSWVSTSRNLGAATTLWWLDIETSGATWGAPATNSAVIEGAVAGLQSMGVIPGIYSTALQWTDITANQPSFPNMALWVPGADVVSGDFYSAQNVCSGTSNPDLAPFAGGDIVVVQYGYNAGPPQSIDPDYTCPN